MTDLIEVKTADLTGAALDWVVAQVEAVPVAIAAPHYGTDWRVYKPDFGGKYSPSTDWAIGGPLGDKHFIEVFRCHDVVHAKVAWQASANGSGDTALIAICRALVLFQCGDSVRVPKELIA